MDPFSLVAAGVGTLGSLAGGIYNAATMPGRKKKWEQEQRERALHELRQRQISELGYPPSGGGEYAARQIKKQADEQFQVDPMSFVPFVSNASRLAGGIYDAASGGGGPQQQRMAPDAVARSQAAAQAQQDELERAQAMQHFQGAYGADNSWRY